MPNIKSAIKRSKQTIKKNERNRKLRSALRTEIKKFVYLIDNKKAEEGSTLLASIHRSIDKAQSKGILPKKRASRFKSRLTLALNKIKTA